MNETSTVYSERAYVLGRLDQLGLIEAVPQQAITTAMRHVFDCTKHDPPALLGMLAWGKAMRSLRDQLVPQGWTCSNARNYATVVHPTGAHAITVAGGDAYTGQPDKNPSTRTEKGPATKDAIQNNQMEMADVSASFPRVTDVHLAQTWILLHFADDEAEQVRMELSLPAGMTSEGYVVVWRERIILAPAPFAPVRLSDTMPETDEIDVPVGRRSG